MNPLPDIDGQQSVARYAAFARRLRALVVDAALVMGIIVALVIGADFADNLPNYGRAAWLLMFCALFLSSRARRETGCWPAVEGSSYGGHGPVLVWTLSFVRGSPGSI